MRHFWKAPLAVLSLTALVGLTGCAPGYYDDGYYGGYGDYGPAGGVGYDYASGGYCDAWGCPDDYYDMPVYYGSVYYGGSWFNGPHYYRDYGGGRQYWVHGGWHNDGWSGARPNWYRPGRTGPALGRDFYHSERFRNSRNVGQRGGRGRGPGFNRNDNRDSGNHGGRDGGNHNAAPHAQPRNGGPAFRNGRFLSRSEAGNRGGGPRHSGGGGNRGGGGGGNRGGGGDHGGRSR